MRPGFRDIEAAQQQKDIHDLRTESETSLEKFGRLRRHEKDGRQKKRDREATGVPLPSSAQGSLESRLYSTLYDSFMYQLALP